MSNRVQNTLAWIGIFLAGFLLVVQLSLPYIFEGGYAFHHVGEPLYFCKADEEQREESHFLAWLQTREAQGALYRRHWQIKL